MFATTASIPGSKSPRVGIPLWHRLAINGGGVSHIYGNIFDKREGGFCCFATFMAQQSLALLLSLFPWVLGVVKFSGRDFGGISPPLSLLQACKQQNFYFSSQKTKLYFASHLYPKVHYVYCTFTCVGHTVTYS